MANISTLFTPALATYLRGLLYRKTRTSCVSLATLSGYRSHDTRRRSNAIKLARAVWQDEAESTGGSGEARDEDTKKEAEILAALTATLRAEKTVVRYRVRAQDWRRQRTLTFLRVVTLILTGHKHALQNALNRFFRALELLSEVPTAKPRCKRLAPFART